VDRTTPEIPGQVQSWTAKRRSAPVRSLLKGETSAAEAETVDWRDKFLLGAENALRSRRRNEEALKDEKIQRLKQRVGELLLDLDTLKRSAKLHPTDSGTPERGSPCSLALRRAASVRC
jgi:CHAD domain-containing protein